MATILVKLTGIAGDKRELPLTLDTSNNQWSTISTGLCVSDGNWDSSLLGANTHEVVLMKNDGTAVVELHNFSSGVGSTDRAAIRCNGTFPADNPEDPIGNYTWEVLPLNQV